MPIRVLVRASTSTPGWYPSLRGAPGSARVDGDIVWYTPPPAVFEVMSETLAVLSTELCSGQDDTRFSRSVTATIRPRPRDTATRSSTGPALIGRGAGLVGVACASDSHLRVQRSRIGVRRLLRQRGKATMRQVKACLVVASVLAMLGGAASAWACEIQGNLVCANDTSVAVPGEAIEFVQTAGDVTGPSSFVLTSDASGNIGSGTHVGWETSWDVTYFGSFTCGATGQNWLGQILVPSTNPKCGGPGGADCSPGFYKNHVTAWCPAGSAAATSGITCQDDRTYTCARLACLLSAEPPCKSKEPQRAFAKACLDRVSPATICSEAEVVTGSVANASSVAEVATAATGGCSSTGGSIGWLGLVGLALHGARRRARSSGQAKD